MDSPNASVAQSPHTFRPEQPHHAGHASPRPTSSDDDGHMAIFAKTPDPRRERYEQLRQIVKLGLENFRKLGQALREIRETELWTLDCKTWQECCRKHWGISHTHAGRLIDAALFADAAEAAGLPAPTSERQVRTLRAVEPEERIETWREAQQAGGTPDALATAVAKRNPRVANARKLKPIRLRVPGGTIVIEPNKRFQGVEETLRHGLHLLERKQAA